MMRLLVLLVGAALGGAALAQPAPPIERRLSLKHRWTGETFDRVYRVGDDYLPDAMAAIDRLFRDYRCNRTMPIDRKLIDLIWELQEALTPTAPVSIISGYRSEGTNASLLAAGRVVDPNSQHMYGHAADVVFPGVPLDRLKAAAVAKGIGGVGSYPFSGPAFVHLDTGQVRSWDELAPEARRALPIRRVVRRLRLDCDATIASVLRVMPAEQALAGLPAHASTGIPPEWLPPSGAIVPVLADRAQRPPAVTRRRARLGRAVRHVRARRSRSRIARRRR